MLLPIATRKQISRSKFKAIGWYVPLLINSKLRKKTHSYHFATPTVSAHPIAHLNQLHSSWFAANVILVVCLVMVQQLNCKFNVTFQHWTFN